MMNRQTLAAALIVLAGSLAGCGPQSGAANNTPAVVSTPPPFPPEGTPLGTDHLRGYIAAARAFKPTDEFNKVFNDSALIGRRFKATAPYDKHAFGVNFY